MKPNPLYIETKSKRIQITLQPSVYNGARKLAEADGLSFNEFVHRKLEEAISRHDKKL
jgi:predicted HicB family RNase H-like nuclease